jgi:hypothetical protein
MFFFPYAIYITLSYKQQKSRCFDNTFLFPISFFKFYRSLVITTIYYPLHTIAYEPNS